MKIIKAERPGGFLDFLPADFLAREAIVRKIEKVFRLYGFNPIETPIIEFAKTLSGETSDTGKNIFYVNNGQAGSEDALAMRFDQTVPLARLLASNPYEPKSRTGLRLPWRRMAYGPVFRGEKPQSGRYRQFYQFDADIAGTDSMMADAEIIAMMARTFKELDVENFAIRINNRKILSGLAELAGISDRGTAKKEDITKEMMRILDKIDKVGLDRVLSELGRDPESEADTAPQLSKAALGKIDGFLGINGDNRAKLKQCRTVFTGIGIAEEGIGELEEILDHLEAMAIPGKVIEVNFSVARGLDYYTGPVMETVLLDAPEFGSVCSGGRYNNLVSRFTGQDLPAVGTSIGVDRLFAALVKLGKIDRSKETVVEAMILRLMPGQDDGYLRMTAELREAGISSELCLLDDTTFKTQFNFAISRGVDFVIISGEDEFKRGVVQVKNLKTRRQEEIMRENLRDYFNK